MHAATPSLSDYLFAGLLAGSTIVFGLWLLIILIHARVARWRGVKTGRTSANEPQTP